MRVRSRFAARQRLLAILVCATTTTAAGASTAVSRPLLVEGEASDPVVPRLVQELRAEGFEVETGALQSPPFEGSLVGRSAVLCVQPSAGIEVWMADEASGLPVRVEVVPVDVPRTEHAGVAAASAAEILRVHHLQLGGTATAGLAPNPLPATPVQMPAEEPKLVPAEPARVPEGPPYGKRARFGFDLGPIVLASPGGIPPALDLAIGFRLMLLRALDLRASFALPLATPRVSSSAGRASVAPWLAGIEAAWLLVPGPRTWSASLGIGVDAAWVRTQGTANAPAISASGDAVCALPFVSARGTRTLWSPHARLAAVAMVGSLLPGVGVRLAGQEVASWGQPLVAGALALEIDAP